MKKKKRFLRKKTRRRVDKVQNSLMKDIMKTMKAQAPEVLRYDRVLDSAVTIPAAQSSFLAAGLYHVYPYHGFLRYDADRTSTTTVSTGYFTGRSVKPISEFIRGSITNTNAQSDMVRMWAILVDTKNIPNDEMGTDALWQTIINPQHLYMGDISSGGFHYEYQKTLFRATNTDFRVTADSEGKTRPFNIKIIGQKEWHVPGNTNGHRPFNLTFEFGYRYGDKNRWEYPDDKAPDDNSQKTLNKGKVVCYVFTSQRGHCSILYNRRLKYID